MFDGQEALQNCLESAIETTKHGTTTSCESWITPCQIICVDFDPSSSWKDAGYKPLMTEEGRPATWQIQGWIDRQRCDAVSRTNRSKKAKVASYKLAYIYIYGKFYVHGFSLLNLEKLITSKRQKFPLKLMKSKFDEVGMINCLCSKKHNLHNVVKTTNTLRLTMNLLIKILKCTFIILLIL